MRKPAFPRSRILALACGLLVSLLAVVPATAQTGTSSVRGTVTDPQGNVVAGATVTLVNTETNASRTQTTGDGGVYSFELIQPGAYRVEVEASGFKKVVLTDVRALVAQPTEVNAQLEVGALSDTVTVTTQADEALVNRQDATLGNNFVSKQITQLPLEARNVAALLTLQPGVTRSGYVAGARADQANVTLDGVDINEAQNNQIGAPGLEDSPSDAEARGNTPDNNTVLRLNAEAVDEFRVVTTNANAQMGRSSGAQVSVITKSGTNTLHGAGFWFHRPTILTANDFFNNRSGVERPSLIRNTYGGAIGGPIVKDKAFFFYSYEGRKDRSQRGVLRQVPLASLGRGEVRYLDPDGNVTTLTAANMAAIFPGLGGNNAAAVAALADAARRYPANDFGTEGDSFRDVGSGRLIQLNTAGYRFNAPLPVDLNSHVGRFDLNLTSRQSLFVRTNIIHDVAAGVPAFPDTARPDTWSHPWGIAAGHTWTISNRFVNSFRYGLTREAFTQQGDAAKNEVYFRFIFFPVLDSRTLSRLTPTHNFTNDFSWTVGNHSAQFGTNIRVIRNERTSFANAFDLAYTNPSYYEDSGSILSNAVNDFSALQDGQESIVQAATAALLGRLTTYEARFTFDKDGTLLPPGSPTAREFATEEYDFYGQDMWKIRPNLSLTYGLRYGLSRPVYETGGFEAAPNIGLTEYLNRRIEASAQGRNYDEPLLVELSGPANGRPYMYPWDRNNFQPRIGIAWSPDAKGGFLGALFGKRNQSVIRGGFAMTNDYIGQQLAVRFDLNNSLGFVSSTTSPVSVCNITDTLCPAFTSYAQDVRGLPRINVPTSLSFPQQQPQDLDRRIEVSLDNNIEAPTNYTWNLTFERELPKGLMIQTSYVGAARAQSARLARRDDAQQPARPAVGPRLVYRPRACSKTCAAPARPSRPSGRYLTSRTCSPACRTSPAAFSVRRASTACNRPAPRRPSTRASSRWTATTGRPRRAAIDLALVGAGRPTAFYNSQYGALSSFSTVANSNYHAGTLSIRERLGEALTLDFNYTFSKSMDDASGLQTATSYGAAFIQNPLRQSDNYAVSDFDIRHLINMNGVWQLPLGRGRWIDTRNGFANTVLGGWQLSGIMRWNSGLPVSAPFDAATWATNWNAQSWGVRIRPVEACPTRGGTDAPALFCDRTEAYQSFRNARPGETGDRNVLRLPGYFVVDMGLAKSLTMPWSEGHKLQLRFEAFNVTNTQRMGALVGGRDGYGLELDPFNAEPNQNWSNFGSIQGERRVMQFGFRYSF